eukprot:6190244-Pleurochrysis_carterae.AAC.2
MQDSGQKRLEKEKTRQARRTRYACIKIRENRERKAMRRHGRRAREKERLPKMYKPPWKAASL